MLASEYFSRLSCDGSQPRGRNLLIKAIEQELAPPESHSALAKLTELKKDRSRARETPGVSRLDDEVVQLTIALLPPLLADMVRLQRLTGLGYEKFARWDLKTSIVLLRFGSTYLSSTKPNTTSNGKPCYDGCYSETIRLTASLPLRLAKQHLNNDAKPPAEWFVSTRGEILRPWNLLLCMPLSNL